MKFRKKYNLYCKIPDNPSNINWENLEKGKSNKCFKVILSFIFIVLILCLAMICNLLLQSFNTQYKKTNEFNGDLCTNNYPDNEMKTLYETHIDYADSLNLTDAQTTLLENDNYFHINNCYCAQYNYFEIIQDQNAKYLYCRKILITFITTISVSIATGIFISIVNFLLVMIISNLILWIPFKSLSTQIGVQILYITIALFVNTLVRLIRLFFLFYIMKVL